MLSIVLIDLQQYPMLAVGKAFVESSVASAPIGWVDRYITSIEISPEYNGWD